MSGSSVNMRERGTLEILLAMPATSPEIMLCKVLPYLVMFILVYGGLVSADA